MRVCIYFNIWLMCFYLGIFKYWRGSDGSTFFRYKHCAYILGDTVDLLHCKLWLAFMPHDTEMRFFTFELEIVFTSNLSYVWRNTIPLFDTIITEWFETFNWLLNWATVNYTYREVLHHDKSYTPYHKYIIL